MITIQTRSHINTYPEIHTGYSIDIDGNAIAGAYTYKRFKYRGKWYFQLFVNEWKSPDISKALWKVNQHIIRAIYTNDLFHKFSMKLFKMIPSYELDDNQEDEKDRLIRVYGLV